MKYTITLLLFFVLVTGLSGQIREREREQETKKDKPIIQQQKEPVYMKVDLWMIYSLARFDTGIDNNLIEIRAYVELRENSAKGDLITDADVRVNDVRLEFQKNRFMKKRILPDRFLEQVTLKAHVPDGPCIKKEITIPTWLKLESPMPKIYNGVDDIQVKWQYTTCGAHVNLFVQNFHTGKYLAREKEFRGNEYVLSAGILPAGESLLRIFIIEPWFNHTVLGGSYISKDSEVNIVSWSQSFIRVKK